MSPRGRQVPRSTPSVPVLVPRVPTNTAARTERPTRPTCAPWTRSTGSAGVPPLPVPLSVEPHAAPRTPGLRGQPVRCPRSETPAPVKASLTRPPDPAGSHDTRPTPTSPGREQQVTNVAQPREPTAVRVTITSK